MKSVRNVWVIYTFSEEDKKLNTFFTQIKCKNLYTIKRPSGIIALWADKEGLKMCSINY